MNEQMILWLTANITAPETLDGISWRLAGVGIDHGSMRALSAGLRAAGWGYKNTSQARVWIPPGCTVRSLAAMRIKQCSVYRAAVDAALARDPLIIWAQDIQGAARAGGVDVGPVIKWLERWARDQAEPWIRIKHQSPPPGMLAVAFIPASGKKLYAD